MWTGEPVFNGKTLRSGINTTVGDVRASFSMIHEYPLGKTTNDDSCFK
jgi:hypothetical protein